MNFLIELGQRNPTLYVFGLLSLIGAVACVIMISASSTQVLGINAWIKPFKFYLSTVIFVWTMGWILHYLDHPTTITIYNWVVVIVLGFELIYITIRAAQGELSHFNVSSSFNGMMFSMMGMAISIMTLFTGFIAFYFFADNLPDLEPSYLWGIRLGLILFVIFAFEGGLMGANLAHTVGAKDGGAGLKLLNWSVTHGDLRIAHFVGMHALQVLPLAGYYLIQSPKGMITLGAVYFLLAVGVLVQALMAMPLIRPQ